MDRKNYQILKLLVAAKRIFAISRDIALPLLITYYLLLTTYCLYAKGIATNCGEISFTDLQIGKSYSMKQIVYQPYILTNKNDVPITVHLSVKIPTKSECKNGYEPLPDVSWIELEGEKNVMLLPYQKIEKDIKITIPKNKKLRGSRFQFYINSETSAGRNIGIGIDSRFLITVERKKTWLQKIFR